MRPERSAFYLGSLTLTRTIDHGPRIGDCQRPDEHDVRRRIALARPRHQTRCPCYGPGNDSGRRARLRRQALRHDHLRRHPRALQEGGRPDRHQRRPGGRGQLLRARPEQSGIRVSGCHRRRAGNPLSHRRCPPEGRTDLAPRQAPRFDQNQEFRGLDGEIPFVEQQSRRDLGPPGVLHAHSRLPCEHIGDGRQERQERRYRDPPPRQPPRQSPRGPGSPRTGPSLL